MIIKTKVKALFFFFNEKVSFPGLPPYVNLPGDSCRAGPVPQTHHPQLTPLTQKASRNCSWAIILGRLLCQMLALLSLAGLNTGQEPGTRPSPSTLALARWPRPSLPPPAGAVCNAQKAANKPETTAGGRGKKLNLFCLGLESAVK